MKITFTIPPEIVARIIMEEKIKAVKALVADLNSEIQDPRHKYTWQQHEGCIYILKGIKIVTSI